MTEFAVTITYDMPCPDSEMLSDLAEGQITSAGRSPWSDRLAMTVHLHSGPWAADTVVQAAMTMTLSAISQAGTGDPVTGSDPRPVAVEVLTGEEIERRSPEPPSIRSRFVSTSEAAEIIGISARAVRQQAAGLGGEQIGEAGWLFPRALIDALAVRRKRLRDAGLVDQADFPS